MFLLKQLAPGLLVAGLVTAVLLGLARWLSPRNSWAGAVALGLGYVCGHVVAAGVPAMPPVEATQWLVVFALVALGVGALDPFVGTSRPLRLGVWLLVAAALLGLLVRPKIQSSWTMVQSCLWLTGLAVVAAALAECLRKSARSSGPNGATALLAPLACAMVCGGTGIALILSGSLLLGQLALVLAATAGIALVWAWFYPDLPVIANAAPVVAMLLVGLWASGYFYAELPATSAALFTVALALPALLPLRADAASGDSRLAWKPVLVRTAVVAVPVAIALFIAFRASPALDY